MTRHYTPLMAVIRSALETLTTASVVAMGSDDPAESDFACRMEDAISRHLPAVPDDDEIWEQSKALQRAAAERHKQWTREE